MKKLVFASVCIFLSGCIETVDEVAIRGPQPSSVQVSTPTQIARDTQGGSGQERQSSSFRVSGVTIGGSTLNRKSSGSQYRVRGGLYGGR